MVRFGSIFWLRSVFGFTRVLNISDISGISIPDGISDSLSTSIRQNNAVLSVGSITVPALFLVEVNSSIVIGNSVSVVIGGVIIVVFGFMVSRGGFVGGSGLVSGSGSVSWSVVDGGMVNGGVGVFVDGMDSGGMSEFEGGVAVLVSGSDGQEGRKSNKGLK